MATRESFRFKGGLQFLILHRVVYSFFGISIIPISIVKSAVWKWFLFTRLQLGKYEQNSRSQKFRRFVPSQTNFSAVCPQFVFLNSKKIKISCFECAQLAWLHNLYGCHHRAYVVQHAGEYYIKSTNIDANKYVNWCQKKFRPSEFRRFALISISSQFC